MSPATKGSWVTIPPSLQFFLVELESIAKAVSFAKARGGRSPGRVKKISRGKVTRTRTQKKEKMTSFEPGSSGYQLYRCQL